LIKAIKKKKMQDRFTTKVQIREVTLILALMRFGY